MESKEPKEARPIAPPSGYYEDDFDFDYDPNFNQFGDDDENQNDIIEDN